MRVFTSGNMLKSIIQEIEDFSGRKEGIATYIIINELDEGELRKEMILAKMIPNTNDNIGLQILGLRVIRTNDIREGMFAVTGE